MEQELEALGEDVTIVVDVESFLESIQLEEYWPAFQAAGWTDMDRLHSMAAEDFEQMAVVKAGHIKKLMRHIVRFHAPPLLSPPQELADSASPLAVARTSRSALAPLTGSHTVTPQGNLAAGGISKAHKNASVGAQPVRANIIIHLSIIFHM